MFSTRWASSSRTRISCSLLHDSHEITSTLQPLIYMQNRVWVDLIHSIRISLCIFFRMNNGVLSELEWIVAEHALLAAFSSLSKHCLLNMSPLSRTLTASTSMNIIHCRTEGSIAHHSLVNKVCRLSYKGLNGVAVCWAFCDATISRA